MELVGPSPKNKKNPIQKTFLIYLTLRLKNFLYFLKRKFFLYFQKSYRALFSPNSKNKKNPPRENF